MMTWFLVLQNYTNVFVKQNEILLFDIFVIIKSVTLYGLGHYFLIGRVLSFISRDVKPSFWGEKVGFP